MKQYLNSEQTTKLIELGFKKPPKKGLLFQSKRGNHLTDLMLAEENYSIGELIEMLPLYVDSESDIVDKDYYMLTIRGCRVMYCDPYVDFILMEFSDNAELIDNLFDMVIFLKENGVI